MDLPDTEFEAANRRGAARRSKRRFPQSSPRAMTIGSRASSCRWPLASGLEIGFAPRDVEGLETAQPADLVDAEISASGFDVHFPGIDADIDVPALMKAFLGSNRQDR